MPENICCKESSTNANEHLYGTAPRVDHWFLLEYSEHWEKDSLEKSLIPETVKSELNKGLKLLQNSRLQLIKRELHTEGPINFYYIKSTEFEPKSYHFQLNTYEELVELDLISLIEKGDIRDSETDEKIAIICTHGAYDSCCGKYGMPVFNELQKNNSLSVWRSTHVGAHRFSANMVMLPEGIYYGRVGIDNAAEIAEAHLKGDIVLDNFRGRCCFRQPSQVSDYFIRKQLSIHGIYEVRWEFEKDRDDYIAVEFLVEKDNLGYSVNSVVLNNAIKVKTSCIDEKLTTIPQFYFYSMIPYTPKPKEVPNPAEKKG